MNATKGIRKLIGTKDFYRKIFVIAIPIMVQNFITNFVGMLDNMMVGQLDTDQMSGVAIVNQFIFVFNISIFGAVAGAGIFGAQFYGKGDTDGVRYSFRFKIYSSIFLTIAAIILFIFAGKSIISLYLHEGNGVGNIDATMEYAWQYLKIIIISLIPHAICQVYASTLRECGRTVPPMLCGIAAVVVNLVFNYIFIFGKFGAPALGVNGAAIATCIARFIECIALIVWVEYNKDKCQYFKGALKSLKIPGKLALQMVIKGVPLLFNEMLWSVGIAVVAQCYALRGLGVVAAQTISGTISNLFNVVFITLGSSVAIIIGQHLGAGDLERAKREDYQLIAFTVAVCMVVAGLMACFAGVYPQIYNTEPVVREYATKFILISAAIMPVNAFTNAAYFTLRSGGKTGITFVFDSLYTWILVIPIAYYLSKYSGMPIVMVYAIVQAIDLVKAAIGYKLIKKGIWINNIAADN